MFKGTAHGCGLNKSERVLKGARDACALVVVVLLVD